jgi:hypothetical protein
MRFTLRVCLLVLIVVSMSLPARGQVLPWNIGVDSAFGLEYLFGRQDLRYNDPPLSPFRFFRAEWDPRVPVFTGMVELTPFPFASGRVAGALSVGKNSVPVYRATAVAPGPFKWNLRGDYTSWEAAGLCHLWNAGGYRFSITAGYRRELWVYDGEPAGLQSPDSGLRNEFLSNIPFLGLQTAMHFPWWKARFEVQGSWFMQKKFSNRVRQDAAVEVYEGKGNTGGVIQLQMEGTAHLTPNVLFGLQARYSYTEFYGDAMVSTSFLGAESSGYEFYLGENFCAFGLNLTLLF